MSPDGKCVCKDNKPYSIFSCTDAVRLLVYCFMGCSPVLSCTSSLRQHHVQTTCICGSDALSVSAALQKAAGQCKKWWLRAGLYCQKVCCALVVEVA